ncbi:hypothetical protein F4819DRAFT_463096 [Hypoxylon fuscum]|nr:hypothetical protein F4819DRAFT_463096 [Hypoxylon fuscum]
MADILNLSIYKPASLPKRLWRVTHSGTQSRKDPITGDLIASSSLRIGDNLVLKEAVEAHVNWSSRLPSCFLSVFSDEQHGRNWARKRRNRETGPSASTSIDVIDTTRLPSGVHVLDMNLLMARLNIDHPSPDHHELLFLHRIPAQCILSEEEIEAIREQEVETERYAARASNPDYHWVPDLQGYYDSNEECELHNANDDMINMIEGNWDW